MKVLGAMCLDFFGCYTDMRFTQNSGDNLFAPLFIRDADHRGFNYSLQHFDYRLNLFGRNIFPTADDNVFNAICNVIVPLLVDLSQIASSKPAIDIILLGFFWLSPVAR